MLAFPGEGKAGAAFGGAELAGAASAGSGDDGTEGEPGAAVSFGEVAMEKQSF